MADIKTQPKVEVKPETVRSDEVLMGLSPLAYGTLNKSEALRMRHLLKENDKKILAANPDAQTVMPKQSYESQPMDEFCDAINDLALGNVKNVPSHYEVKSFSKEDAIKLRDAAKVVVALGKRIIKKGHVFDLRFDQRGYGWAKLTENWRKGEDTKAADGSVVKGKNVMQDEFDSYKGNDTVQLF